MADQNQNKQSNQNQSRGQQGQGNQGNESEPRQTQSNESNQSKQGRSRDLDDESTGIGESRERSNREPATMANDRGVGSERQGMRDLESDELESEEGIESDLDSETEVDEDIEGGSNR